MITKIILNIFVFLIVLTSFVNAFNYETDFTYEDYELRYYFEGFNTSHNNDTTTLNNSLWYIQNNKLIINAQESNNNFYFVELKQPSVYDWSDYIFNVTTNIYNQNNGSIGVNGYSDLKNIIPINYSQPKYISVRTSGNNSIYQGYTSFGFRSGDYTSDNKHFNNAEHYFSVLINTTPTNLKAKIWNVSENVPVSYDDIDINILGTTLIKNGSVSFSCQNALCVFDDLNIIGVGNNFCILNYSCSLFSSCVDNVETCLNVSNSCGEIYTGDINIYDRFCLMPTELDLLVTFDNTNNYVLFVFVLWLIFILMAINIKESFISNFIFLFTGVLGIFISIWLFNIVEDFPKLVSVTFGLLNGMLFIMVMNKK